MSEKSVRKMVCIGNYMKCLKPLYTKIRSKETGHVEFVKYANRIMTLICEEGFAYSKAVTTTRPSIDDQSSLPTSLPASLPTSVPTTPRVGTSRIIQTSAGECLITESYDIDFPLTLTGNLTSVKTPTGSTFIGIKTDLSSVIAVSIIRAGDAMLDAFLTIIPEAKTGKILIQRNEKTLTHKLLYTKLPGIASTSTVILLDPMLATGGSVILAIKEILEHTEAVESNITLLCVVAAPEGVQAVHAVYPYVTIITGEVDAGLNDKKYIIPGLGDFGDRFYGTY